MNKVSNLPDQQRRELFRESAALRGMNPAVVEKDFWVCWVLKQLFSDPELRKHLVFKGGTTLSKVFGLTERSAGPFQCSGQRASRPIHRGAAHGRSE